MCFVMGSELSQGDETPHHPHKLYVHLCGSSTWDRKRACERRRHRPHKRRPPTWQRCVGQKAWPAVSAGCTRPCGQRDLLERGSVPCPREPQSPRPLSIRELGEGGVTLPWTTWGCLLCWMSHSGECFSQTVCGLGKPPSQSEIRSESLVICPLSSTASLQSESSFHCLAYSLTPSVCRRPARAQTSGNTAV